jgi:hypothetical protein
MLRASVVGVCVGALVAAPPLLALQLPGDPSELATAAGSALGAAVDAVGWVLVPQLVLAVAVLSLALEQLAARAAGLAAHAPPAWIDPAVESALLLGMLGTISGMVKGFAGISPDEIQPGPLVHGLGTALRSSFVGFGIALVGVWTRTPHSSAATVSGQELAA